MRGKSVHKSILRDFFTLEWLSTCTCIKSIGGVWCTVHVHAQCTVSVLCCVNRVERYRIEWMAMFSVLTDISLYLKTLLKVKEYCVAFRWKKITSRISVMLWVCDELYVMCRFALSNLHSIQQLKITNRIWKMRKTPCLKKGIVNVRL